MLRAAGAVRQHGRARREPLRAAGRAEPPARPCPLLGLGRGQRPPGEHQVSCADRSDQPSEHLAVVSVGDAAQQLGHSEGCAVADDGHVAAKRDLQAAALTQPVDRRDHRFDRLAQGLERRDVHAQRDPNVSQLSEPSPPPMSPPGANTSPVPVMSRPARSGSASTCRTAYLMPKYIAGVIALRASGGPACTRRTVPRE